MNKNDPPPPTIEVVPGPCQKNPAESYCNPLSSRRECRDQRRHRRRPAWGWPPSQSWKNRSPAGVPQSVRRNAGASGRGACPRLTASPRFLGRGRSQGFAAQCSTCRCRRNRARCPGCASRWRGPCLGGLWGRGRFWCGEGVVNRDHVPVGSRRKDLLGREGGKGCSV